MQRNFARFVWPTLTPTSQVVFAHYTSNPFLHSIICSSYHSAHSIGQNIERRIWAQVSFRDPYLGFCIFSSWFFFPFLAYELYIIYIEKSNSFHLHVLHCLLDEMRILCPRVFSNIKPPNCKHFFKIKPWLPKLIMPWISSKTIWKIKSGH